MKKFLLLLVLLCLSACSGTANSLQTDESQANSNTKLYQEYSERISHGLKEFRQLISSNEEAASESALTIEIKSVSDLTTEGALLTRFTTSEGKVVRYTFELYGKTGKAVQNYHYFDDGLTYLQHLRMDYADMFFSRPDNRHDILKYTLENYLIVDEKTFLLDDANMEVTEASESRAIVSFDRLNSYFEAGENYLY